MHNILYSEFLKLKKSPIILILIIGAVAEPLLMLLGQLFRVDIVEWDTYMGNIEAMTFLFVGLLLFTLIASYIFTREFTERVAYTTYSYPVSRTKIFICKLLTIFVCIFFMYAVQFVTILITGSSIEHAPLNKQFLILNIKIYFFSMLFQFAIVPLAIFIASVSKNLIVPMVYSSMGVLVTLFIAECKEYNIYFPLYYPAMPLMSVGKIGGIYENGAKLVFNNYSIIIAIAFFIITSLLCIVYYEKSDVC